MHISRLSPGITLALIAALPVALSAQNPPLRILSKMELEYAEPFSCISGIRELSDGRLIVSDVREKTIQLIDLRKGTATRIGREGQGPGEWSLPQSVFAVPGDTTLLWDPQNQRFLVIHPDGSVGKSLSISLGTAVRGQALGTTPRAADALGRLYYQGSAFVFNEGQPPTALDSAPILRYDRRTSKVDTLTFVPLPRSNVQQSGTSGNVTIRMTGPNPLAPQHAWSVAPDGRIAIVSPEPYRVEWISAAGTRTKGPALSYDRQKVTDADKAPIQSPNCGYSVSRGGGGGGGATQTQTRAALSGALNSAPPRTDYPEYRPPFATRYGAPAVAPNGELWVGRSRGPNDPPVYDVFDARGQLSARVQLPQGTRVAGFGNGSVYLYRMDEDDLVYLQRYRLDGVR